MAKRFIVAFFTFLGLIIPAAFVMALLAAPARPQPSQQPGCKRHLAQATTNMVSQQALVKRPGAASCS